MGSGRYLGCEHRTFDGSVCDNKLLKSSDDVAALKAEGKAVNAVDWKIKEGYFDNLQLPVGGAPVFEDMDGDGDLDMIIGTEQGTLEFYRNIGG